MSTCQSFTNVSEVPSIFGKSFEITVLGFVSHAPVPDEWTNPAQNEHDSNGLYLKKKVRSFDSDHSNGHISIHYSL